MAIAFLGLLLASSTVEAQRMRPPIRPPARPMTMQPMFFAQPRIVYVPRFYPQMYSANSYANGGYGSYMMMPYGMMSYGTMPYGSSYGSNQAMPYGASHGSYQMMPYGNPYGTYSSGSSSAKEADTDVAVRDNYYEPKKITVLTGTTVRWTNSGQHDHTVSSDDGSWLSDELVPGQVYDHTFTAPGTYPYHCLIRGHQMRGVVVVKEQ
jgi:plastocyanin